MLRTHTIPTQIHGRYLVRDGPPERLFIGFHGYGQTAEQHMEDVEPIPGLDAWTVAELWLMGAPPERAQHVVDITATFDRKIAALRAHVSQTGRWTELEQRIRGFGAATAARFRLPEGHIAEVFQVVTIG